LYLRQGIATQSIFVRADPCVCPPSAIQ
jgi:hypothetical protein